MAVPCLLYGSETWIPRNQQEVNFQILVKGYSRLDHLRNSDIRQELWVWPVTKIVTQYKERWREFVICMTPERIPRNAVRYRQLIRCIGRLRMRWWGWETQVCVTFGKVKSWRFLMNDIWYKTICDWKVIHIL